MDILGRKSIRRSLMAVLLMTSSAALLIATLGFAINDWLSVRASAYERLSAQAAIISGNSVAALTFDDHRAASATLATLQNQPEIIGAVLFDQNGATFATYREPGQFLPDKPQKYRSGTVNDELYVQLPIALDDEIVGSVLLISDLTYWQTQLAKRLVTVSALFVLSLLSALLISSKLQRILTEPLLTLARTARSVRQNQDFSLRANKESQDEIGMLVDDFNAMLEHIQLRDNELKLSQESLERKVQERTWELTELTRELEHHAYHDTLTGLANRITFDDHLKMAISQAQRYGSRLAVLFLDLDRFKVINDTLGHAIGDQLLIKVAGRLKKYLRSSDTLARLGGDEFAVLMLEAKQSSDAADVAGKLLETINAPFHIEGYNLHISTSIGISVFPEDGDNATTILKNADTAMYKSKDRGRNKYSFFTPEMNERALRRLALENKLRAAVESEQFTLHFQPRRRTSDLEIIGVEALIRWNDPVEGPIPPSDFIPLADECGLISKIDEWVLENACLEVMRWHGGKRPGIALSVNFSAAQFVRDDLYQIIEGILTRTGFPGDLLELEITENLFGPDTSGIMEILSDIRRLGVEISIDDFGKAYSSLSRLKQLPLHTLKIDQSFISDIGQNPDDEVIVRTIITMAHNLGLKVVAEGVETETQFKFIRQQNCDAIQGYLFGKPMPGTELEKLLQSAELPDVRLVSS